jgi:archaeal cell division control protein 6
MANIFSKASENKILKDERFLYPDYVPQTIPFRDSEIGEMVFSLKPATQGKKPTNLFLTGVPGTGKTLCSKHVLSEMEEYSDRIKTIYVNCFELNTRHNILAKITNALGYPIPTRGLSGDEIFERFVAVLKNKKIIPILVFDEAERLLIGEDTKKMLYDLARLNEQFKVLAGLVFISNDEKFLSFIDDRIRSSLNASVLSFEKYGSPQLKEILKERAKFAFYPNVLSDNVIPLCSAHASKKGDARLAIDTLLKAGRIAEKENSSSVLVSHVRKAFQQETPAKIEIMQNLNEQEKQILKLLEKKEATSGEIYSSITGFAERTLRKAIFELNKKGLVEIKKVQKVKGFTRIISKKNSSEGKNN